MHALHVPHELVPLREPLGAPVTSERLLVVRQVFVFLVDLKGALVVEALLAFVALPCARVTNGVVPGVLATALENITTIDRFVCVSECFVYLEDFPAHLARPRSVLLHVRLVLGQPRQCLAT